MRNPLVLLCVITVIVFFGCSKEPGKEVGLNEKLQFNSSLYHTALKNRLLYKETGISNASVLNVKDTLFYYYAANSFQPVILQSFEEHGFVESILAILRKANEHGLNPEYYNVSLITNEFVNAVSGETIKTERYEHLSNAEILLADAIINYASHIKYGLVNPRELFADTYFLPVAESAERDMFESLKQPDILNYLIEIQPKNKKYKGLQAALKHFMKYENVKWQPIPEPLKKIEPGNTDPLITLIAERLITLEYIDTSVIKINDYSVYDSMLIGPVKEFQLRNGLIDDGIIGIATVEKLNVTPAEYIEKIKINLERFRWNDYSNTPQYIQINIPDFRLHVIENGEELFDIKVCTGIKRPANFKERFEYYSKTKKLSHKPDDWETPCFSAEISNLVLNPTWTVPQSIIREEIAREVRNDSLYLMRKNFTVYKDGSLVNPAEVKAHAFINERGFTIVQDPGPLNALGRIKFMFKNPFGIYLHDTPSRAPFNKANRAVSHGCVRVEKPIMLSEYLLKNHSEWNIDYLKVEIGMPVEDNNIRSEYYQKRSSLRKNSGGGRPTELMLDKKIPLFIDYYTAWMDKEGKVHFRDDVYRKDKVIKEFIYPEKHEKDLLAVKDDR